VELKLVEPKQEEHRLVVNQVEGNLNFNINI
jgi:hypothetical protein